MMIWIKKSSVILTQFDAFSGEKKFQTEGDDTKLNEKYEKNVILPSFFLEPYNFITKFIIEFMLNIQ